MRRLGRLSFTHISPWCRKRPLHSLWMNASSTPHLTLSPHLSNHPEIKFTFVRYIINVKIQFL